MSKGMPKFYDMETITQEKLNKLALERNTLARKVEKLEEENKKLKEKICEALEFYEQYGANFMKNGVIAKSIKTILKGE